MKEDPPHGRPAQEGAVVLLQKELDKLTENLDGIRDMLSLPHGRVRG